MVLESEVIEDGNCKVLPRAPDLVNGVASHAICSVSPSNLCPAEESKDVTRTISVPQVVAGDPHNVTTVTLRTLSGVKLNGMLVPDEWILAHRLDNWNKLDLPVEKEYVYQLKNCNVALIRINIYACMKQTFSNMGCIRSDGEGTNKQRHQAHILQIISTSITKIYPLGVRVYF